MAERQVALVPTMIQIDNFGNYAEAGEAKFPAYAKHIRALYASRLERFGRALDAGVPIYAGTDAGGYLPHGLVGKEIAALAGFSSPEYALGAGSWRARTWLGRPDRLVEQHDAVEVGHGNPVRGTATDDDTRAGVRAVPRRGELGRTAVGTEVEHLAPVALVARHQAARAIGVGVDHDGRALRRRAA